MAEAVRARDNVVEKYAVVTDEEQRAGPGDQLGLEPAVGWQRWSGNREITVTSPELGTSSKVKQDATAQVVEGRVRIVTIEGFDAQACGGTHVHSTAEIGRARVAKFDNKGKDNKRFYWDLSA